MPNLVAEVAKRNLTTDAFPSFASVDRLTQIQPCLRCNNINARCKECKGGGE